MYVMFAEGFAVSLPDRIDKYKEMDLINLKIM
jgi:hypothetical protein